MEKFPKCYVGSADTIQDPIKRKEHYHKFITEGYDDTETYTLYQTIAKFIVPRLKRYREINGTRSENKQIKSVSVILEDSQAEKIDEMIIAFSFIAKEGFPWSGQKEYPICISALKNFSEMFPSLWW